MNNDAPRYVAHFMLLACIGFSFGTLLGAFGNMVEFLQNTTAREALAFAQIIFFWVCVATGIYSGILLRIGTRKRAVVFYDGRPKRSKDCQIIPFARPATPEDGNPPASSA